MKKIVRLRAHHGMCLAFFEGKGYSRGFTANMEKVKNCIKDETEVELCMEKDVICSACPNLKNGICATGDKVEKYDRMVLEACGFSEGVRVSWREFSRAVEKNIIRAGRREKICGGCSWTEICTRKEREEQ